ncbi:MAG: 4-hydroxy-tetrahydrodipicolinate synthase [Bacteroidia bacterium]|jgi:4-hydroxy-tetrahydrodipicolinate synthase|nr:4-hydroxy-tetrahydrodipicolinate synthase [Bacteroidia bacterium]
MSTTTKKASSRLNHPFRGTGVAMVTPFADDGSIDYKALKKVTEHIVKGKCEFLVVMGTTGEAPALYEDEKNEVLQFVLETVNGRVPVVFGIGGNNTAEVIHKLETTNLIGVSGILSVAPYYNKPNQNGLYEHFRLVAEASPLPVLLYNVPGRSGMNMTAETQLRLAHDFPRIVGTKEASGNMEQIMVILRDRPADFLVLSGDDMLTLPMLACGADGVISVVANAYPKQFSDMVRHGLAGDFAKARPLHESLIHFTQLCFADGNPGGIKVALDAMKLCTPTLRAPLYQVNETVEQALRAEVKKLK